MEKLSTALAAARSELDAQAEPARRVAALETQLADAEIQAEAEANLARVKQARRELTDLLDQIREAEATMRQACKLAYTCWEDAQAMGLKVIPLRFPAMAESTPVPRFDCPFSPETVSRLSL